MSNTAAAYKHIQEVGSIIAELEYQTKQKQEIEARIAVLSDRLVKIIPEPKRGLSAVIDTSNIPEWTPESVMNEASRRG